MARGSYSCNGNVAGAAPDDGSDEPPGKGGLSTGAKAGIAIGTIASVALLAALAFFLWKWRRRTLSAAPPDQAHAEPDAAPVYHERGIPSAERKDDFEMDYYSVQPQYDASSQKGLIQRESEMGRPTSGQHPGPEGRHEMFGTKDPPAAHELPAQEVERGRGRG